MVDHGASIPAATASSRSYFSRSIRRSVNNLKSFIVTGGHPGAMMSLLHGGRDWTEVREKKF
ncbi:hypothetical protein C5167_044723 [Papaver somniferum]|nr:hypothetical protein C5167_044723 [Papaver somniferum]